MAETQNERDAILQTVRQWPLAEQFSLVQEVLANLRQTVAPGPEARDIRDIGGEAIVEPPLRRSSMRNLVGLLATDQPPPTDEEVDRWLEEHRMEKYGR